MKDRSLDKYIELQNKEDAYKIFGLITAVYIALAVVAMRPLDTWVFTQWIFSYEFGFVKRGLHGEIVRQLGIDGNYVSIFIITVLLLIGLNILLITLFSKPLRIGASENSNWSEQLSVSFWIQRPIHIGLALFFLMAVYHSATMQRLFQFPGYLEHVQLVLVFVCFYLIRKTGVKSAGTVKGGEGTVFLSIMVICMMALLIHEGFLLFYVPFIFAYWIYKIPGNRVYNALRFILFGGLILFTWFVATYGLLPADQYQSIAGLLESRHGDRVDPPSLIVLFRDFGHNLQFTQDWFYTRFYEKLIHLILTILILSPTVYVFWQIYKSDFQIVWGKIFKGENDIKKSDKSDPEFRRCAYGRVLLVICCCSPLAMAPLGIDLFRWIAMFILNLFIATTLLMAEQTFRQRTADQLFNHRHAIGLSIAFSLIFGPLAITTSYLWVYKLVSNLPL